MIRVVIILFWLSFLVGTLVSQDIVANRAVTLVGLFFLARWWMSRSRDSRLADRTALSAAAATAPEIANQRGDGPRTVVGATSPPRSHWTVDRVHAAEHRWR